jgi:hypothetical protein
MCSNYNPICDVQKVISGAGATVVNSVFGAVARAFANAAADVTKWMWTVIAGTTTVDLSGGWFTSTLGITVTLAGFVIAALFVFELIKAVLRQEPGALGRASVGIGAGILGAAASIGVVTALLAATDALSDGVVRTAGLKGISQLGAEVAPTAAISSVGSPALMLILGLGYILASFFVWAMFIMRKAMLIVAAVFAPIAFAGAPLQATRGWIRKWIEFTVALIFSKLVVVILFTLAVELVGSPGKGMAAVGNLFSGLALLIIACFAPWLLFRLVHFVGGDVMAAHHQAAVGSATQAGSTPISMARSGAMKVAGVVGAGSGGAALAAGSPASSKAGAGGATQSWASQSRVTSGQGSLQTLTRPQLTSTREPNGSTPAMKPESAKAMPKHSDREGGR